MYLDIYISTRYLAIFHPRADNGRADSHGERTHVQLRNLRSADASTATCVNNVR